MLAETGSVNERGSSSSPLSVEAALLSIDSRMLDVEPLKLPAGSVGLGVGDGVAVGVGDGVCDGFAEVSGVAVGDSLKSGDSVADSSGSVGSGTSGDGDGDTAGDADGEDVGSGSFESLSLPHPVSVSVNTKINASDNVRVFFIVTNPFHISVFVLCIYIINISQDSKEIYMTISIDVEIGRKVPVMDVKNINKYYNCRYNVSKEKIGIRVQSV